MKTMPEISDPLLDQAKALALKEGSTFSTLVEEGLRMGIESRTGTPPKPFRLRDGSFKAGKGLQLGIEWTQLFSLAYDDENGRRKR